MLQKVELRIDAIQRMQPSEKEKSAEAINKYNFQEGKDH